MRTRNELSTRAALCIASNEPIPLNLTKRLNRVEELAERQGHSDMLSRQIIAVVIEQWERDVLIRSEG